MNDRQKEENLTLELLNVIEEDQNVSQRRLAKHMGVALGLANSYLKRCVRKGFIKVQQAPANRYLYYLTPKGFAEKSRLTAQYLSYSLNFYRNAGDSCLRVFELCAKRGETRVLLAGASDLAEIATLKAMEAGVEVIGVYDPDARREEFLGKAIYRDLPEAKLFDVCVVTELDSLLSMRERLTANIATGNIVVPDVLGNWPDQLH